MQLPPWALPAALIGAGAAGLTAAVVASSGAPAPSSPSSGGKFFGPVKLVRPPKPSDSRRLSLLVIGRLLRRPPTPTIATLAALAEAVRGVDAAALLSSSTTEQAARRALVGALAAGYETGFEGPWPWSHVSGAGVEERELANAIAAATAAIVTSPDHNPWATTPAAVAAWLQGLRARVRAALDCCNTYACDWDHPPNQFVFKALPLGDYDWPYKGKGPEPWGITVRESECYAYAAPRKRLLPARYENGKLWLLIPVKGTFGHFTTQGVVVPPSAVNAAYRKALTKLGAKMVGRWGHVPYRPPAEAAAVRARAWQALTSIASLS